MLIFSGQMSIHLETGETSEFTLHLNFAENVKSIRIYASNNGVHPALRDSEKIMHVLGLIGNSASSLYGSFSLRKSL